jgi:hypothetical protein
MWPPNHPPPCKGWPTTPPLPTIKTTYTAQYPVLENITRVYNPLCTPECCKTGTTNCPETPTEGCPTPCPDGQPATVPPSPRDACIEPTTGDGTTEQRCGGVSTDSPGIPCGPWPGTNATKTYDRGTCQPITVPQIPCQHEPGVQKIYGNCYKPNGKKKKFGTCTPYGHKTLIGGKNWHGADPFGLDGCPTLETMGTCGDCPSPDCSSVPMRLNPALKKYRTATVTYTQTSKSGGGFHDFLLVNQTTYTATNSVDKWGKITRTATGHTKTTAIQADGTNDITYDGPAGVPPDLTAILAYLTKCAAPFTAHLNNCGPFAPFEGTLTIGRDADNKLTLNFTSTVFATGYRIRFDCPDGTVLGWYSAPDNTNCDPPITGTVLETIDLGDTWDVTIQLSDPYTYADVLEDIRLALATWDLSNHHLYPPRTDTITNGGPLVNYNERSETNPLANAFLDPLEFPDGWLDTSVPRCPDQTEGQILGKPLPIGAGPHFDIYHYQWLLDNEHYGIANPRKFGQWSNQTLFNIPHATQWTDEIHHLVLPHAPFIFANGINGAKLFYPKINPGDSTQLVVPSGTSQLTPFNSVMVATHAQIKIPAKNHNYNRPCGTDLLELDLASVRTKCANTDPRVDAAQRWPTAPEDCDHDNPYWNDPWPKGKFLFKEWGYNFRDWLESYRAILQAESRRVDNLHRTADADPCHPACPELTPPAPVRFTKHVEDVDGCFDGDRQLTTLNTGQLMNDADAAIGGSKWLATQTVTQHCIVSTPCNPGMIYIQPAALNNLITDPEAVKINMPYFNDGVGLDYIYGTLWIGRVEQVMTDPLWTPPGKAYEQLACTPAGIATIEDDGLCHNDTSDIRYYPQRPYEEAEAEKPTDAPAMPSDARILGCKNYVANLNLEPSIVNAQDAFPGLPECASPYHYFIEYIQNNISDPCLGGTYQLFAGSDGLGHFITGLPVQVPPFAPWRWYLDRQTCVAQNGRFATQYK